MKFLMRSNITARFLRIICNDIVTDLINTLPGNSSISTVQQATLEEAVFSENPTEEPIDWLYNNPVLYVYCISMSVPRFYPT
jgi:hypothetical protein